MPRRGCVGRAHESVRRVSTSVFVFFFFSQLTVTSVRIFHNSVFRRVSRQKNNKGRYISAAHLWVTSPWPSTRAEGLGTAVRRVSCFGLAFIDYILQDMLHCYCRRFFCCSQLQTAWTVRKANLKFAKLSLRRCRSLLNNMLID